MSKINTIGIFAPAASIREGEEDYYHQGVSFLEDLGLKVKQAANVFDREELLPEAETWLPGSAQKRLDEMMRLWSDLDVDALIAMRGGYGCIHLLDKLDYDYIAKNPKPVFGYSDLTAIFCALYTQAYKAKLELFHTPMVTEYSRLNQEEKDSFINLLGSIDIEAYANYNFKVSSEKVLGGNLSLISSLVGSKYLPDFRNSILFLEDCKEPAYKVERMMYHLEHAGKFDGIKELRLGVPNETEYNYNYLEDLASKKNFKLTKDVPVGHARKLSLVLG